MFTDKSSNKVYLGLIEMFANGVNSKDIMNGQGIDDITESIDLGIPEFLYMHNNPKSVIFATLARAIRNITIDKKSIACAHLIRTQRRKKALIVFSALSLLPLPYVSVFPGRTQGSRTLRNSYATRCPARTLPHVVPDSRWREHFAGPRWAAERNKSR